MWHSPGLGLSYSTKQKQTRQLQRCSRQFRSFGSEDGESRLIAVLPVARELVVKNLWQTQEQLKQWVKSVGVRVASPATSQDENWMVESVAGKLVAPKVGRPVNCLRMYTALWISFQTRVRIPPDPLNQLISLDKA